MLKDKFIVTYAGTSYPEKGVDVFLEAIKKIKNENIKFCLLGKHQFDIDSIEKKNTSVWFSK
jgi:glycosyltransferase involved in cell wall biosynthesis